MGASSLVSRDRRRDASRHPLQATLMRDDGRRFWLKIIRWSPPVSVMLRHRVCYGSEQVGSILRVQGQAWFRRVLKSMYDTTILLHVTHQYNMEATYDVVVIGAGMSILTNTTT